MWVTDVLAERVSDPRRQLNKVGELVHGWFGFPVWAGDDMVGIVEFFSRQIRQPDEELLEMTEELGRLIGQHLGNAEGRPERSDGRVTSIDRTRPRGEEPPPETVSSILRGLGKAATTVAGAMEQRSDVRSMQGSPELLRELAASVGKLDWRSCHQGVRALGLESGDEVPAPAYHHDSKVQALIEPGTGGVEALLSSRTRALHLVHYLAPPGRQPLALLV